MLPIIPNAVGFGMETTAGRGGEIYEVTSLEDRGFGSLRYGLESIHTPRKIVVGVAGTVRSKSIIAPLNGNFSFHGQTAPGVFSVAENGIRLSGLNDVFIEHLRIRHGGPTKNRDCLLIDNCNNVVISQSSLTWSTDELLDIRGGSNITIRRCLFGEPLEPHDVALRIGPDTTNCLIDRSLFIHSNRRNPLVTGGCTVIVAGNVIYNYGSQGLGIGGVIGVDGSKDTFLTAMDNVFLAGAQTNVGNDPIRADPNLPFKYTVEAFNNYRSRKNDFAVLPTMMPNIGVPEEGEYRPQVWLEGLERVSRGYVIREKQKVLTSLLFDEYGAKPQDRIDWRIMQDLRMRKGLRVDAPPEGLPIQEYGSNAVSGEDEYTELELQLHNWPLGLDMSHVVSTKFARKFSRGM